MKAYFVALLIASSILLSLVDTGSYKVQDSTEIIVPSFVEEPHICGPKTFSNSVRSAFIRESDLEKYSSPQLYLTKEWVVVLKEPYCLNNLGMIVDNSRIESYHDFDILSGTWIIEFQTGDLALQYLNELHVSDYVWKFYPMVEQHLDLRYEPDDPYYESGDQWYLDNYGQNGGTSGIDLNTQGAWNEFTGNGIVIGVVDDGIDYDNPDLSPNFLSQYSYDYCGNDTNVMPVDSYDDGFDEVDWHGTAVAGIVAGKGDNDIGIAGVAYNASLVGLRLVAGDCSFEYAEDYMPNDEAVANTFVHEMDVIDIYTNSWGPADTGTILGGAGPLAIAALETGTSEGRDGLGTIYTWANGNGLDDKDQSNKDSFANSRYTISVGAVDWQGEQTWYSETGSNMLVSAPSNNYGEDPAIFTTDVSGSNGDQNGDYTSNMGGTSAATPMVAGVVALMLEANQNLTWRDVQHILVQTSRKVDSDHSGWFQTKAGYWYNHAYGYGLVDATEAVNMAKSWQTVDSEIVVNMGEITVNDYIFDDRDSGVSSTIIVNQSINIESIEVLVDVSHKFRGDLNFFLTSPSGIVSELVREHSDPGHDYDNWIFSSVVHWGENSFGEWTLKVNDTVQGGDIGSPEFRYWNLTFYGTAGADNDEDGLPNYAESVIGTGLDNPDHDGDGLLDGEEFYGWLDYVGSEHRTSPLVQDTDNDDLSDWVEGLGFNDTGFVTDPNDNDTDDDGLLDGEEINDYFTNPTSQDTDGDTLSDFNEIFAYLFNLSYSDPTKIDSDNDTMPDPYELANGFDPMKQIDGWLDSDYDGFDRNFDGYLSEDEFYTNAMEYSQGTNPRFSDSDLCEDGTSCPDGMYDGWEYYWGLDPLSPDSEEDLDNDTLSNIYEYDNMLVESKIFSLYEPSLRAYWKFDGTDSFTALDMTTNSNLGISMNGLIRVPASFGNGMYCDGVDDYAELDSLQNSKFTEYTIHSWVKLTNYTSDFGTVFGTVDNGRTWLGVNSENYFEFRVFSGNKLYISPITNDSIEAELGVWYNLAATYSESQDILRLYVNGILVSEMGITPNHSIQTATNFNYMCRGQNGEYLNGTIDNLAVWGRALNSDEIQYVYEQPLGFGNYYSFKNDDGILSTNPTSNDTDSDGLSDSEESYFGIDGYITDPTNPDTDGDRLNDSDEVFIYYTNPTSNDTDSDNFTDDIDLFPLDTAEWNDTDNDGVGDNSDVFPLDSNETLDSDGDKIGDNMENSIGTNPQNNDTDSDGINDYDDKFPLDSNETTDTDSDGYGDNSDACPENPKDYLDTDSDGYCDNNDAFPDNPNEWLDTDNDGYGDNSDEYPEDPNRALPPSDTEYVPLAGNYSLDTIMLVIVALGVTYFVVKIFVK